MDEENPETTSPSPTDSVKIIRGVEKACAITFCEFDDDEEAKKQNPSNSGDYRLIPVCMNGHAMHAGCIRSLVRNQRRLVCPHCRDDSLGELKHILASERFDENNDDDIPDLFDDEDLQSLAESTALLRTIYDFYQTRSDPLPNTIHTTFITPNQPNIYGLAQSPWMNDYHGLSNIRTQPHRPRR